MRFEVRTVSLSAMGWAAYHRGTGAWGVPAVAMSMMSVAPEKVGSLPE
ncbi:hypothetical protein BN126370017 [Stenotrophomonas indicatrix]|nr:hypothetical protein BN126370017 [Stenotrophomonas indicatrix]